MTLAPTRPQPPRRTGLADLRAVVRRRQTIRRYAGLSLVYRYTGDCPRANDASGNSPDQTNRSALRDECWSPEAACRVRSERTTCGRWAIARLVLQAKHAKQRRKDREAPAYAAACPRCCVTSGLPTETAARCARQRFGQGARWSVLHPVWRLHAICLASGMPTRKG